MSKPSRPRPAHPDKFSARSGPSYNHDSSDDDADTRPAVFAASTIPAPSLSVPPSVLAKKTHMLRIVGGGTEGGSSNPPETAADDSAVDAPADSRAADDAAGPEIVPAVPETPFRFLDLPTELRLKVYGYYFADLPAVLDLTPDNQRTVLPRLQVLRTCRAVYGEAAHVFYSTRAVRVFSTHGARFHKTRRHLLARLKPRQRAALTRLELRLGPGFGKPPRSWVVGSKLGLGECVRARTLAVFVQLDPSTSFLDGYRQPGFYEAFSAHLLDGLLRAAPAVEIVEFDAYASVRKTSPIMALLLQTAQAHNKKIAWGRERGWTDADEEEEDPGRDPGGLMALAAAAATLTMHDIHGIHDSPVSVGA